MEIIGLDYQPELCFYLPIIIIPYYKNIITAYWDEFTFSLKNGFRSDIITKNEYV
ncbi:MAG: hypothetical protein AB6733_20890 [Clostridiaceae bacterium]